MRLGLLLVAFALLGCAREMTLAEPPIGATLPPEREPPERGGLRDALLAELGRVDAALRREEVAEPSLSLRERRLAIEVALALHAHDAREGRAVHEDADHAIAEAERRIAEARSVEPERADLEAEIGGQKGEDGAEQKEKIKQTDDWRRALDKGEASKPDPRSCSPGDPLCGELQEPPRQPSPTTRGAARVASHGPAPSGVLREVKRHFGRVEACVPRNRRHKERQLRVQMMLDQDGALDQVRVSASDLEPSSAACIEDVFASIRVADYQGDNRVVTLPLWIRAAR